MFNSLKDIFCSCSKMYLPSSHMLVMNAINSFDQYCPVWWFVGTTVLRGNIRPLKESQGCIKEVHQMTCLAKLTVDQWKQETTH